MVKVQDAAIGRQISITVITNYIQNFYLYQLRVESTKLSTFVKELNVSSKEWKILRHQ